MDCIIFSSIPGLCFLNASSTDKLWQPKRIAMLPYIHWECREGVERGKNFPQLKTNEIEQERGRDRGRGRGRGRGRDRVRDRSIGGGRGRSRGEGEEEE